VEFRTSRGNDEGVHAESGNMITALAAGTLSASLLVWIALVPLALLWEWKRKKASLEREVERLRWVVLGLGLVLLVFQAAVIARLDRVEAPPKSSRELSATRLSPQKSQ
jgi:hypothetical protein